MQTAKIAIGVLVTFIGLLVAIDGHAADAASSDVILSTTTSTEDSGLLDVLVPVHQAISVATQPSAVARRAREAAEATVPMLATRGRASFLGERSIGHMDPGARSSALMVEAAASVLESAA